MTFDEQGTHWDLKYEQGLPSLEKPDPFYLSAFDQFVRIYFQMAALRSISPAGLADMRFGWQRETGRSPSSTSPRLRSTNWRRKRTNSI